MGDVKFEKNCILLSVNSSKTVQFGKGELMPIVESRDPALCAVKALKFLMFKFRMSPDCQLFSCCSVPRLTYSMFAKCFKKRLCISFVAQGRRDFHVHVELSYCTDKSERYVEI